MSDSGSPATMQTTADKLRAQATQHDQDAADSFERCDTDGFLSQWASGINAQIARKNADIADDNGVARFERTVLQSLDGTPVNARLVNTRFGQRWRVDSTDEWLPYQPARESTLAKRGYQETTETAIAPAKAISWAPPGARGMSGATSVQVIIIRTDAKQAAGWRYQERAS